MSEFDQTFDSNILIGHFVILPNISALNYYIFSHFFQILSEYDQTFDPNILIGHCDPILRFSDFVLHLGTQLVYFYTSCRL